MYFGRVGNMAGQVGSVTENGPVDISGSEDQQSSVLACNNNGVSRNMYGMGPKSLEVSKRRDPYGSYTRPAHLITI